MAKLVCFGDSVHWGQGLPPTEKFANILATALGLGSLADIRAHSGAIIGIHDDFSGSTHPEVPFHYPTVKQQVASYEDSLDKVGVVIVNGGINDIGVDRIMNPTTTTEQLGALIKTFCFVEMCALLKLIAARFPSPARIVVTSYYPFFSTSSDFAKLFWYLVARGFVVPSAEGTRTMREAFTIPTIRNSLFFWTQSTVQLENAVHQANVDLAAERVLFAKIPFSESNSMFAGSPWLFDVTFDPSAPSVFIEPLDGIRDIRLVACEKHYNGDNLNARVCWLASAGHPNAIRAAKYASTVAELLNEQHQPKYPGDTTTNTGMKDNS